MILCAEDKMIVCLLCIIVADLKAIIVTLINVRQFYDRL